MGEFRNCFASMESLPLFLEVRDPDPVRLRPKPKFWLGDSIASHMIERGRQLDKYSLIFDGSKDAFGNCFASMASLPLFLQVRDPDSARLRQKPKLWLGDSSKSHG